LGLLPGLNVPQRQKQKLSTRTRPETKSPPIRLGLLPGLNVPQRQKQKLSTRTRPETKSPPIRLLRVASRIKTVTRITLVFVRKGCLLSLAPLVLVYVPSRIARSRAGAVAQSALSQHARCSPGLVR
jgi:hypothetical protein